MVNDSLLFVRRDPPVPPPPPPPLLLRSSALACFDDGMVLHVLELFSGYRLCLHQSAMLKVLCTANLSPRAMPPFFEEAKAFVKAVEKTRASTVEA